MNSLARIQSGEAAILNTPASTGGGTAGIVEGQDQEDEQIHIVKFTKQVSTVYYVTGCPTLQVGILCTASPE